MHCLSDYTEQNNVLLLHVASVFRCLCECLFTGVHECDLSFVYFFRTVTNKNERAMCTNIITELRNYQFFSIAIFIIVTVSVSYQVTGVLMYNYHQQL